MKKRLSIMIILLVIIFGGIIGFNLFKGFMIKRFFASYEAPAVTVSSVKATKIDWQPHLPAVGNFVAVNGVEVGSQASGNVVSIHFESGQYVAKDAPLIDIDDSVDQANLRFNQAELALKEINYKRQADLFKRGATPSSSVDEAKANLEQSQANVEKIQAQIKQKHIAAPFAGQVGIRLVNLGQYITPGTTSVVTLQSLDPLYLEFYLPEQYFKQLSLNQKVQVRVEEFPNVVFEGKISAINSKVDPNTHNIQVQATLPNCPITSVHTPLQTSSTNAKEVVITCNSDTNTTNKVNKFVFLPGMFAAIAVEQQKIPNVIVLPSTSISYSLYGNSVFIIEENKEGKKDSDGKPLLFVKRVFVSTGAQDGNFTVINSGVKEGQLVVSSGELKLENGTRVVINNDVQLNTQINPDQLSQ